MKDYEFLEVLKAILDRKTSYQNVFPYNLGYYDGISQSYDCWNLVKAIDWSNGTCANFWSIGQYAIYSPSATLGDWTGRQILNHCSEVSTDMTNIPKGAFLLYYDDSHAGVYMGNGKVCECTPIWGGGVLLSDIGPNGERTKNGSQYGRWGWHGKLPFVEYTLKPEGQFHEGDIVTIIQGAKVYGTDIYFASWVYGTPLKITQLYGDRAVVSNDQYVIGAVSTNDLLPYEEPIQEPEPEPEPEPWHPGTDIDPEPIPEPDPEPTPEPDPIPEPEPVPEPIPEPEPVEPEPDKDEKESFLVMLVKALCQAIVDVFKKFFGNNKEEKGE